MGGVHYTSLLLARGSRSVAGSRIGTRGIRGSGSGARGHGCEIGDAYWQELVSLPTEDP